MVVMKCPTCGGEIYFDLDERMETGEPLLCKLCGFNFEEDII